MRADLHRLKRDSESGRSAAANSGTMGAPEVPVARVAKPWKVGVPILLFVLLAASLGAEGLYYRYRSRPSNPLTDKSTIVLSDFDNKTTESVFDDALKQGLSVQLEQSPFFALVSESKVRETLKRMGRNASERVTPEVAREICQRAGGYAVLTGSIASLGSQYVLGLKAVDCESGNVLADAQEQAASKEGVLKGLDAAAVSLRSKLGESLSSVQKYAAPVEDATTASLEALKAYSMGQNTLGKRGHRGHALLQARRRTRSQFRGGLSLHRGDLCQPQ
jgi:hypothetical protein